MTYKLPHRVSVLDLETAKTNFDKPETCVLAFVGVKVYVLNDSEYQPEPYQYYLPERLPELERFLNNFPGIIVGHNILNFDYRVLRPHISLNNVIEKTVDTLAFLFEKNGKNLNGLGLGKLSALNFGTSKTIDGEFISKLWQEGNQQQVIAYNDNDCVLTFALWRQLINKKNILVGIDHEKTLRILKDDIPRLTGNSPLFTFASWEEKIARDGYVLIPPYKKKRSTPQSKSYDYDYMGEPEFDFEAEFNWFYCDHCIKTFLFQSQIQRGFSDYEEVFCPECNKSFGEIRADYGYTLVGEVAGDFGNGMSQGDVPEPFEDILLKHIEMTRPQWAQLLQISLTREDVSEITNRCTICGRPLWNDDTNEDSSFENPADGSPICVECLTAGRWLLTLK